MILGGHESEQVLQPVVGRHLGSSGFLSLVPRKGLCTSGICDIYLMTATPDLSKSLVAIATSAAFRLVWALLGGRPSTVPRR